MSITWKYMIRWTTTLMKQILILARALAFILILSIYQITSEFFYVRRIIYTLAFKCNIESNIVSNSNLLHIIICVKIKKPGWVRSPHPAYVNIFLLCLLSILYIFRYNTLSINLFTITCMHTWIYIWFAWRNYNLFVSMNSSAQRFVCNSLYCIVNKLCCSICFCSYIISQR